MKKTGQSKRGGRLAARLRYLWRWEAGNVLLVPLCVGTILWSLERPVGPLTLLSLTAVTLILLEGAVYWKSKLDAVRRGTRVSPKLLRTLGRLKWVNWGLIVLGAGGVAGVVLLETAPGSRPELWAVIPLLTLTILEQINYYYVQLMYDHPQDLRALLERRRLKSAALGRDLRRIDL